MSFSCQVLQKNLDVFRNHLRGLKLQRTTYVNGWLHYPIGNPKRLNGETSNSIVGKALI